MLLYKDDQPFVFNLQCEYTFQKERKKVTSLNYSCLFSFRHKLFEEFVEFQVPTEKEMVSLSLSHAESFV